MSTREQDWKRPPIIEVVLGMQFDTLPGLTNGHLGWFWGEMNKEFPCSDDMPPIRKDFELFGKEAQFGFPEIGVRPATGESRLRMRSADGARMIQVQNGWLVANWTKQGVGKYPGFSGVKGLFDNAVKKFSEFLENRNLGKIRPNLWEVTYIDHIPVGTVWETLADLPGVFPGLFGSGECANGSHEVVDTTWVWRLAPNPGRLLVNVQSARTISNPEQDILLVKSVARGPLGADNALSIDESLSFGRSSVVDTFNGLASERAKRYWRGD